MAYYHQVYTKEAGMNSSGSSAAHRITEIVIGLGDSGQKFKISRMQPDFYQREFCNLKGTAKRLRRTLGY